MTQLSRVRVLFDLFDLFPVQHYFVSNVTIWRRTSLCRGLASDAHTRQFVGVHVEVQNVQESGRFGLVRNHWCKNSDDHDRVRWSVRFPHQTYQKLMQTLIWGVSYGSESGVLRRKAQKELQWHPTTGLRENRQTERTLNKN